MRSATLSLGFPAVLVAGTKGKGSTVAMLSACLHAAGYRTARYTSPHLVNWRERTSVDARAHLDDGGAGIVELRAPTLWTACPTSLGIPTTFEVGTALTFEHFARQAVDVAVVEVGTGGRFDATNLVDTRVVVDRARELRPHVDAGCDAHFDWLAQGGHPASRAPGGVGAPGGGGRGRHWQ